MFGFKSSGKSKRKSTKTATPPANNSSEPKTLYNVPSVSQIAPLPQNKSHGILPVLSLDGRDAPNLILSEQSDSNLSVNVSDENGETNRQPVGKTRQRTSVIGLLRAVPKLSPLMSIEACASARLGCEGLLSFCSPFLSTSIVILEEERRSSLRTSSAFVLNSYRASLIDFLSGINFEFMHLFRLSPTFVRPFLFLFSQFLLLPNASNHSVCLSLPDRRTRSN